MTTYLDMDIPLGGRPGKANGKLEVRLSRKIASAAKPSPKPAESRGRRRYAVSPTSRNRHSRLDAAGARTVSSTAHDPEANCQGLPPGQGEGPFDVMRPKEQEALSSDIHFLGDLLGDTIRRVSGEEVYQLVEEIRPAAKALRTTPSLDEATGAPRPPRSFGGARDAEFDPRVQCLLRPHQPRRATHGPVRVPCKKIAPVIRNRTSPRRPRRLFRSCESRALTPLRSPRTCRPRWSARSSPRTRRSPPAHRFSKSFRQSPPVWTPSNSAACCRKSAKNASAKSPRKSKRSGFPTPSAPTGRPSSTKSAKDWNSLRTA